MADNKIFWSSQPILPIGNPATSRAPQEEKNSSAFADILAGQETKVKFSKHANERLRDRRIDLSDQELAKLDDTVERMAAKGARESLIYMNDMAFVVSVKNRTVITAMDGTSAKENIFTNIDSAAIL
ncbi:MAG: flagellar protein [Schwartzia sp.]|nr:flagellar protein [Schwartzia sp. (in: firmicutes)]